MKLSHRPEAPRVPEALLKKGFRRNVTGIVLFELVWGLGVPFVLYISALPAYLTALGTSKALLGFVMSLWTILAPLQLLSGHYFNGPRRMRTVTIVYIVAIALRLLYDVLALFVPGMWSPAGLIGGLVLANICYVGLLTVGQAIYMGVLTDNIPRKRRGWVFGMRTLGLGIGGILTGAAASLVMHHWGSPVNYRVSFVIGDAMWLLSCFALLPDPRHGGPPPAAAEGGGIPALPARRRLRVLVANPNYRIFLFSHLLNAMGERPGHVHRALCPGAARGRRQQARVAQHHLPRRGRRDGTGHRQGRRQVRLPPGRLHPVRAAARLLPHRRERPRVRRRVRGLRPVHDREPDPLLCPGEHERGAVSRR